MSNTSISQITEYDILMEKINALEKQYVILQEGVFQNQILFWTVIVGVFAIIGIALYFIAKSAIETGIVKGINQANEKVEQLGNQFDYEEVILSPKIQGYGLEHFSITGVSKYLNGFVFFDITLNVHSTPLSMPPALQIYGFRYPIHGDKAVLSNAKICNKETPFGKLLSVRCREGDILLKDYDSNDRITLQEGDTINVSVLYSLACVSGDSIFNPRSYTKYKASKNEKTSK